MLEYRIDNFDRRVRRVLQTGDLHLQDKLLERQRPILRWISDVVETEGVDLVCITGDIAGWHVPHRASDAERNAFARFVFRLCVKHDVDVVVAMGNHDLASNWAWLGEGWPNVSNQVMDRIHFVDRPASLRFGDFRLQVMTYPAKHWVGTGADGEGDLRAAVTEAAKHLGCMVNRVVERLGDRGETVFYTGHHGTVGATYGARPAPSVEAENFTPEQVLATGCHAAGFNHIHLPQRGFLVDGVAGHHVGAPYHLTFGDEGRRGVGVWSFEAAVPEYKFHRSPSEPWVTVTGRWNGESWDLDHDDKELSGKVRVRLTWSEGDGADVSEALKQIGAADAKVELTVEKRDAPAVTWDHSATLVEQFASWCRDARGREPTDNELMVVSKAAGEVDSVR